MYVEGSNSINNLPSRYPSIFIELTFRIFQFPLEMYQSPLSTSKLENFHNVLEKEEKLAIYFQVEP